MNTCRNVQNLAALKVARLPSGQHLGCMVSIFNTFEKLGLGAPTESSDRDSTPEVQLHNCIPCNIDHVCPISSNPMFDNKRRQCGTQWQCGSTSEEVKETMCVEC